MKRFYREYDIIFVICYMAFMTEVATAFTLLAISDPVRAAVIAVQGAIEQIGQGEGSVLNVYGRTNCFIQNPISAAAPLYVHWTASEPTRANSVLLRPGAAFTCAGDIPVVIGTAGS